MTPGDLRILIQEGEGTTLEFKESLSSSFARELVALANTIGGKILIGVRDDGTVIGVHDSNTIRARIQDIARNCDPPVKVLAEPVGGVFAVHVRESAAKPVQCGDGFFWRQGAVTQKLNRDEIRDFFRVEGVIRFDLSPCPRFRYPRKTLTAGIQPGTSNVSTPGPSLRPSSLSDTQPVSSTLSFCPIEQSSLAKSAALPSFDCSRVSLKKRTRTGDLAP